ncbi:hypothetical protein [Flagellimonas allohymeniacidonis]|uniref:Uncharacterized protein n=1 Tax=Flagellimonas allohymeniacidonis TaxID=2517819 RepID=A0A4Q8QBI6_9FLAO|nr:hypothetical protein [Allomuricauda hymeniacidonis]TAI47661.1 hypothetical protein EW142_13435 [Allomuricauda hymeniacidonis]
MNKLLLLYGCTLIGSTTIAAEQNTRPSAIMESQSKTIGTFENHLSVFEIPSEINEMASTLSKNNDCDTYVLNLNEIEFIEEEIEIDLGFDPYDYLPQDFSPYEVYVDLNAVPYIEEEEGLVLGFDTTAYLPEGFDAYSAQVAALSLNYIEEEDLNLGFDPTPYLPEGFSPYEVYFDLSSIEYIEEEEEIDLDTFLKQLDTVHLNFEPSK